MKKYLVGSDEVGRGCLFGPVVAAAVILGNNNNFDLKDSKKLSEKKKILSIQRNRKKCNQNFYWSSICQGNRFLEYKRS